METSLNPIETSEGVKTCEYPPKEKSNLTCVFEGYSHPPFVTSTSII